MVDFIISSIDLGLEVQGNRNRGHSKGRIVNFQVSGGKYKEMTNRLELTDPLSNV